MGGLLKESENGVLYGEAHLVLARSHAWSAGNCGRLQSRHDFPTPEDEGLASRDYVRRSAGSCLLLSDPAPLGVPLSHGEVLSRK